MPYKTLDDLPDAVKALPDKEAREAWMQTYNAAHKQYNGDEAKANATAWAQVKKMGYEKRGERWVKAESFRKDLLAPGVSPHPNKPEEKFVVDDQLIRDILQNTRDFMRVGGKIPVTVSHPHDQREKISAVCGWVKDIGVNDIDTILFADFDANEEAAEWIRAKKVQSVSPGIVYDAVTSHGKFPVLLDHVALTNSPHFLGQGDFIPVTADRFSEGFLFFEGGIVGHANGIDEGRESAQGREPAQGGIMDEIKKMLAELPGQIKLLFESATGKNKKEEDDMNDVDGLKAKLAAAEKERDEITADRDKLKTQLEGVEAERKKKARTDFEARVDAGIKATKILPTEKDGLLVQFERLSAEGPALKVGDKEILVTDAILAPFEIRPGKTETILGKELNKIRFESGGKKLEFDLTTLEGKNAFAGYVALRAQAEKKTYPEVREAVLAEARLAQGG